MFVSVRAMYDPNTFCYSIGEYPPHQMTQLIDNYRSHKAIIELPNRMFYHGKCVSLCVSFVLCVLSLCCVVCVYETNVSVAFLCQRVVC